MGEFSKRPLRTFVTLGDRFQALRKEGGFSLDQVAAKTGIPVKHLKALEAGRYDELPAPVYTKNFVRKYADFLEVRQETALRLFDDEYAVSKKIPAAAAALSPPLRTESPLTPNRLRLIIIGLLALGVLVYLSIEINRLISAPELVLESPPETLTTSQHSVEFVGTVEPETTVTANGKQIFVDRSGRFREVLDLQDGLNTIIIRAEKKRGSAKTIVRKILVQP